MIKVEFNEHVRVAELEANTIFALKKVLKEKFCMEAAEGEVTYECDEGDKISIMDDEDVEMALRLRSFEELLPKFVSTSRASEQDAGKDAYEEAASTLQRFGVIVTPEELELFLKAFDFHTWRLVKCRLAHPRSVEKTGPKSEKTDDADDGWTGFSWEKVEALLNEIKGDARATVKARGWKVHKLLNEIEGPSTIKRDDKVQMLLKEIKDVPSLAKARDEKVQLLLSEIKEAPSKNDDVYDVKVQELTNEIKQARSVIKSHDEKVCTLLTEIKDATASDHKIQTLLSEIKATRPLVKTLMTHGKKVQALLVEIKEIGAEDVVVQALRKKGIKLNATTIHALIHVLHVKPKVFVDLGLIADIRVVRQAYMKGGKAAAKALWKEHGAKGRGWGGCGLGGRPGGAPWSGAFKSRKENPDYEVAVH